MALSDASICLGRRVGPQMLLDDKRMALSDASICLGWRVGPQMLTRDPFFRWF